MLQDYIFIVGCARTGTTLLRQILSLSPRVCIAPETHFIRRFTWSVGRRTKNWGDLGDDSNLDRMIDFMYSGRAVAGSSYWSWLKRHMDRAEFREQIEHSDRTERGIFEVLMQVYADQVKGDNVPNRVLGEKTPGHLDYVPTLLEWFPNAKVVHTFRDPRAILISELKKMRKKGREGPKRLLPALPGWLNERLELPFELVHTTRAWLEATRWHLFYQERYPESYTLLRFEDLVTQPEPEVRRLCEFLNIPFEPGMITGIRVVGSGYETQHRSGTGFDTSALNRWKSGFPPALQWWFKLTAGKQMKNFGYI